MEQEQINIEDIMQEIRAEIRAKGYADNEIPFSDIACLVGGTEVPFDLKDYLDDISMMDESRTVLAYRDISSTRKGVGKLITFVKKVIRKMVCFYVEPLVDDQKKYIRMDDRILLPYHYHHSLRRAHFYPETHLCHSQNVQCRCCYPKLR